jgi:hypothetical protein
MNGRSLCGVVGAGLAAAVTFGWGQMAEAASPTPTLPLPSGVSTPSLSSVSLPMGHLGDPDNTFWELFLRSTGSGSWALRTPAGVADNGGLAVTVSGPGTVTVGFQPSQLLRFSPLAKTSDSGKTWLPGDLSAGLVGAPDALAGGGPDPTTALVNGSGQTVLSSTNLVGWHQVATTRTLAKAVKGCGVQRITALASDGNYPILGVQCRRAGRIGVLYPRTGSSSTATGGHITWSSGGPRLTDALSGSATVLRLEATANAGSGPAAGLNGLAMVRSGRSSSLVAFWSEGIGSSWTQSSPLTLPTGWTVSATAIGGEGAGRGITVLLDSGVHRRIVSVAGPGARWITSPVPPVGTEAVAAIGSETDAFVVTKSHLTIWALAPGAGWSRVQSVKVPVPYGSSG